MPTLFKKNLNALRNAPDKEAARRSALRATLDTLNVKVRQAAPRATSSERWVALADVLGVSIHAIMHWTRHGRVPTQAALLMQERFGKAMVSAAELDEPEVTA